MIHLLHFCNYIQLDSTMNLFFAIKHATNYFLSDVISRYLYN